MSRWRLGKGLCCIPQYCSIPYASPGTLWFVYSFSLCLSLSPHFLYCSILSDDDNNNNNHNVEFQHELSSFFSILLTHPTSSTSSIGQLLHLSSTRLSQRWPVKNVPWPDQHCLFLDEKDVVGTTQKFHLPLWNF